jgi:mannose-6-phosphate isomerase-like protein (cupin superfamily)
VVSTTADTTDKAADVVETPVFPGGTAVSGLQVYEWAAADGLCGGSPHVHLACTEAYIVVGGEGSLQTLTTQGLRETPLRVGTVVWFGPGTIHRAINGDGTLRVVVLMQNAGLPEAGDAVLTFPTEVLADAEAYAQAVSLLDPNASHASDEQSARRRRDLAVAGFHRLVERVESGDGGALEEFYRQALALRADRLARWEELWRDGPALAVQRTAEHLAALRQGGIEHLLRAAAEVRNAPAPADRRYGMCGRLDTYDVTLKP